VADYLVPVEWILANVDKILSSAITVVLALVVYKIIVREIRRRELEKHLAYTLIRVARWGSALAVLSALLFQWGVTLGVVSAILAIFGGTIIGFASVNTLGNAIAGLIVMTSRPFKVGDRIFFNDQFLDVVSVELIYTKMKTLDNVIVSIPNQELLKARIDNYGRETVVRRHCAVTPGFEYDSQLVEKALLEAAEAVQGVLAEPKPYVWITGFGNYAVEYTLYVFINDIRRLREIDAELHRKVLDTCKKYEVDISTPLLLKQIEKQT
jgi:small-conductance mechanosensitive channel